MKTLALIIPVILLGQSSLSQATGRDSIYLFSYFVDNGQDGLHIASSEDGFKWIALNEGRPFVEPRAGKDKLMRDPCIIQSPDGLFHMVWTVSWEEKGIGYASSKDLLEWSEQKYIPVMEHEPDAMNCWAPEIFYDDDDDLFMIFWSTTIPGRFPETDHTGDEIYNHRMYYVTSPDMRVFSETKLLYDQGFNVIDGSLLKYGDQYFMFLKDETLKPVAQKNIRISTSPSLTGPYSKPTEPIFDKVWVEGPTVARIGENWVVYFDKYRKDKMGAAESRDLIHWKDISHKVDFPEDTRHGSVLRVNKRVLVKR
jgi:beta-xylosidase